MISQSCDTDLELYIAESEIRAHQIIETDGSTSFERCTGEMPRTVNSSLFAPVIYADGLEQCIDRLSGMEAKAIRSIYGHCQSLMEYKVIQTDKRARYNKANCWAKKLTRSQPDMNTLLALSYHLVAAKLR